MNYVIGLTMFFGMSASFYFLFVNKEVISFKNYLKNIGKVFLKLLAVLILMGSVVWIPMFILSLMN